MSTLTRDRQMTGGAASGAHTFVADVAVQLLEHVADLRQRAAPLVQQRQHTLADAHVADEPQVANDERGLCECTKPWRSTPLAPTLLLACHGILTHRTLSSAANAWLWLTAILGRHAASRRCSAEP